MLWSPYTWACVIAWQLRLHWPAWRSPRGVWMPLLRELARQREWEKAARAGHGPLLPIHAPWLAGLGDEVRCEAAPAIKGFS